MMRHLITGLTLPFALLMTVPTLHAAEITVAGGCFWCIESDYEHLDGVSEAVSGFTGGATKNPKYKQVTKGGTGHYEAVQVTYNPSQISLDQLYSFFFRAIDPTDAGGQFCDRGDSYRTAIFVDSAQERQAAETAKAQAEQALGQKIATPILDAGTFYAAEDYHQDYYKSDKLVITRFGPLAKKNAYKRYRTACGRDAQIEELWGKSAHSFGS